MPLPPWQVRHARKLIAATVLVVLGVAYGGYRTWQFYLDPSDRIAAAWRQGKQAAVPPVVPAAAVVVPEPVRPAPAVPAAAQVVRVVPAVTHTRRETAPLAAAAPAAAKTPACPEGIVAVGLCTPEREDRK